MNNKSYELYDENEYFLKYLNIHPKLIYSNNDIDNKKKEFQLYLLDEFNKEIISYDELETRYNNILNIEKQNLIQIENIKFYHKNIEDEIIITNNNNLIMYIDNIIKK